MTKKTATTAAGSTGSLAFQYAHTLVAQRLGGSYQAQAKQSAPGGAKHSAAPQSKKTKPSR
ncbi:hypothetical protein [Burkholderia stagnalis]|uniref:hypothetical protein n=1 Tax=Burkholderia stagnalis TaxID=1503054 RepID=UPI000F5AD638|nr:hypothetical protein [Burkholderia stagnalis]